MAFVAVEQWHSGTPPPLPLYRPLLMGFSAPPWFSHVEELAARWRLERPLGLVLASMVAVSVLGALAGITRVSVPQMLDRLPLVLQLIEPVRATAEASAGGAAVPNMKVAQAPVPPSPIETSTPTPVSPPEWRVSRVPRLGPTRPGVSASNGVGGTGSGGSTTGIGSGGTGAYDPYAGAAPRWRPSTTIRADGIDEAQLQAAIAEVKRRYPGARGTVDLKLRLSAGGMVLDLDTIGGTNPAILAALRAVFVGKRLAVANSDPIGGNGTTQILRNIVIA